MCVSSLLQASSSLRKTANPHSHEQPVCDTLCGVLATGVGLCRQLVELRCDQVLAALAAVPATAPAPANTAAGRTPGPMPQAVNRPMGQPSPSGSSAPSGGLLGFGSAGSVRGPMAGSAGAGGGGGVLSRLVGGILPGQAPAVPAAAMRQPLAGAQQQSGVPWSSAPSQAHSWQGAHTSQAFEAAYLPPSFVPLVDGEQQHGTGSITHRGSASGAGSGVVSRRQRQSAHASSAASAPVQGQQGQAAWPDLL